MTPDPLSPNTPVAPEPNPDLPTPGPPTPGPDLPPAYPPLSPGAPLIEPPLAPVTMSQGTAYPEPPPSYEQSPVTPPAQTQGVDIQHSTFAEPTYQPETVAHTGHALPHPTQTPSPADSAYPDPPPAYERRASDHDANPSKTPSSGQNLGRRHTDRVPSDPPSTSGGSAPARAPVALLGTLIVVVLALLAGGAYYFLHAGGHVITAGGELAATAAGLHYENSHEHIAFTAPGTWTRFPASTAQVMVRGEGCSFGLLEQRTLLSAHQLADAEAQDLHRRHPEASPVISPRTIAGKDALTFSGTYTDSEGQPMTQTYILVDRGTNLLTLIETGTSTACPTSFSTLEDSLHL